MTIAATYLRRDPADVRPWAETCGQIRPLIEEADGAAAEVHHVEIDNANLHYHEKTDEFYYVIRGQGTMVLDDGHTSVFCPAYRIDCVDTTGAGDTWFGGLLVALRKNMPLERAGKFANRAAADCCTALGASAGVRSFDETITRV